jgi:uncharacterized protein
VRSAVIDSSSLINLAHLGLAEELKMFFQAVLVPAAVQKEVNRKQRFRYRLNKLYRSGLYRKCSIAQELDVTLLLPSLDSGEAEALIQARDTHSTFLVADERRARKIGEDMGLKPLGTMRILARLHLLALAREPRMLARKLRRDVRFRVSDEVIDEAIARASEPF